MTILGKDSQDEVCYMKYFLNDCLYCYRIRAKKAANTKTVTYRRLVIFHYHVQLYSN